MRKKTPTVKTKPKVTIDHNTIEVFVDGRPVENLTRTEFDLIAVLVSERRVFTREEILEKAWKITPDMGISDPMRVNTFICRLRSKLKADVITTRPKSGYIYTGA